MIVVVLFVVFIGIKLNIGKIKRSKEKVGKMNDYIE